MGTRTTWLLVAFSVTGCELVANIQNLELTGDAATIDVSAPVDSGGGNDVTVDAPSTTDAALDGGATSTELIDDMEANTGLILATKGRSGAWFTYNDGTSSGTQAPTAGGKFLPSSIAPPRGASDFASRTNGSGFTLWGSGMGFNLNDPPSGSNQGIRSTYDASAYEGFVFWARVGTGTTASVRFNVPSKNTDTAGGVCSPVGACSDYFGVNLTLTETWTMYTVKFSELHQLGWGQPVSFDSQAIYGCQVKVDASVSFDVWIDDIAFLLP